jgi:hypothetical protein
MIKGEKWVMGGKELQHIFFRKKKSPEYDQLIDNMQISQEKQCSWARKNKIVF